MNPLYESFIKTSRLNEGRMGVFEYAYFLSLKNVKMEKRCWSMILALGHLVVSVTFYTGKQDFVNFPYFYFLTPTFSTERLSLCMHFEMTTY